jgi:hypothetical protein
MSSNPTTTTEPAPRRHRLRKWLLIAFGALVLLVLVGRLASPATPVATAAAPAAPATVAPTEAPAPVAPAPAEPVGPATSIAEEGGTYAVGVDLKPGTYHTAGSAGLNCYWQRERAEPDKYGMTIIANGNSQGPVTVTIKATDATFMTTGCQQWVKR